MFKPGDRVRMTKAHKAALWKKCRPGHHVGPYIEGDECQQCSSGHVKEFGNCIGIVEDLVQPGCPELNVRWLPSKLRYGYLPDSLERA